MIAIPGSAEWKLLTNPSAMSWRDADLVSVDKAIALFEKNRTVSELKVLDVAFKAWKRKNPKWLASPRNAKNALLSLSNALLERVDPILEQKNYIWCPGADAEMTKCAANMIKHLGLVDTLFEGKGAGLEKFGTKAKLYILAHGHVKLPLFTTKSGKWTASQLAELLVAAGVNPHIKEIEMLVCHAGESVNTIASAADMSSLMLKNKSAIKSGDMAQQASILEQYNEKVALSRSPQHYERGSEPEANTPEAIAEQSLQLLPLAAQLADALKNQGLSNFVLTSYKAPVSQDASPKKFNDGSGNLINDSPAGVRLDLTGKCADNLVLGALSKRSTNAVVYALARDYPEYIVSWR